MWSTCKIHKYLTSKPGSSQNGRFQEYTKREPLIQNGRVEIYVGGRVKDLHYVNHMHQIKYIMERKMLK